MSAEGSKVVEGEGIVSDGAFAEEKSMEVLVFGRPLASHRSRACMQNESTHNNYPVMTSILNTGTTKL